MWTLRAGRGDVAAGVLCLRVVVGAPGVEEQGSVQRDFLSGRALLRGLSLVSEVGATLTLRWVGAGPPAASDD